MEDLERIGALLRVLAHPLRLRILDFLETQDQPQPVSKIVAACEGTSQSIVSQQLRILRDCGMITFTKKGARVYYSLQSPLCSLILSTLRCDPFRHTSTSSNASS